MVVAQETASGRAAPRWIAVGIAVAMIALVTVGWSLVNALVPGRTALTAGEELALGGDGTTRAVLVLPDDGWEADVAASHPDRSYRLHRGPLVLDVERPGEAGDESPGTDLRWEGTRRVLLSQDPSTRVGEPSPVVSADGTEGLAADVNRARGPGTVVLLPSPDGGYAVRMLLQGTDGGPGTAPEDLARMITFSEEAEHG
ncbi:hypothetical protein ACFVWN_26880 [Nocardiopsis flavescens]|uniref:Uncharacterized protein n=1 Tax=Nocardiopsis flavescens TaxID=758803 RepID=A0A1M6V2M0_9ACTN|nr:hypothetical protein [Nocardiopsis flavescens]SHK75757.1 hypothetical protein SAMN05421803_13131 [Nocardiopsis flavescens]